MSLIKSQIKLQIQSQVKWRVKWRAMSQIKPRATRIQPREPAIEPNRLDQQQRDQAVDESVGETPKGSFPKSAHLRKHADFQRVYQQGRRHFSGNMTVFYLRSQSEAARLPEAEENAGRASVSPAQRAPGVRVGFTVSRALGGAVDRNRMRRRTREAVRQHLGMLAGIGGALDVVINPKKSLLQAEFVEISREVERAFAVIRQGRSGGAKNGGAKNRAREARQG